jgi:hypothetical protein
MVGVAILLLIILLSNIVPYSKLTRGGSGVGFGDNEEPNRHENYQNEKSWLSVAFSARKNYYTQGIAST